MVVFMSILRLMTKTIEVFGISDDDKTIDEIGNLVGIGMFNLLILTGICALKNTKIDLHFDFKHLLLEIVLYILFMGLICGFYFDEKLTLAENIYLAAFFVLYIIAKMVFAKCKLEKKTEEPQNIEMNEEVSTIFIDIYHIQNITQPFRFKYKQKNKNLKSKMLKKNP